ncbi:uncharacterized protein LOC117926244 isoform X1 [Vitis riparia]|uniref:uncharacterized protein LOC117926244 isoform X1 n=1 Tax=Vitis riparia TaxID=96939 RepID=UPI00155ACEA4|nr:uncharacterized protein LOC117926244 isoform X1 [Vitis riparia]
MGGGMEAHKNKFIEEWGAARENLEYNFRWTRRNLVLAGIFGVAVPILVYRGIVKEFLQFEWRENRVEGKENAEISLRKLSNLNDVVVSDDKAQI